MTKLPESLEKKRNELAKSEIIGVSVRDDAHAVAGYHAGFNSGALEVKQMAEKLVEALRKANDIFEHTEIDSPERAKAYDLLKKVQAELEKLWSEK